MFKRTGRNSARQAFLFASVSISALSFAAQAATAQTVDIGTVQGSVVKKKKIVKKAAPVAPVASAPVASAPAAAAPAAADAGAPIASDQAIGNAAPQGSAPALAPSQASLNASEPGSIVSRKVIQDIAPPTGDYNETAKYTPGFNSSNPNGALGDSKSSWRGFTDGQFNVTYDAIPFGDANDPTHHSGAYFPGPFIGSTVIDRGPGSASTIGYAPFGGTMGLHSLDLSDKAGTSIAGSAGNFGTYSSSATTQSGLVGGDTRAMFQASYDKTDGALDLAHVDNWGVLGKLEKKFGDTTVTLFGNYSRENYNNTAAPNYAQLQAFGTTYASLNNDPRTQQYTGYNNSQKQTDMEYADVKGHLGGWQLDNKVYTYSYWYPALQNNSQNQSIIFGSGATPSANAGTLGDVKADAIKVLNPPSACAAAGLPDGCKTSFTFTGVNPGDVTGYLKYNNLRAYGDIATAKHDVDAGYLSGQLRTGIWLERVDNTRYQQYYDYTTGVNYANLTPKIVAGNTTAAQDAIDTSVASFKLDLDSHITNYEPFAEYEWKPTANLSITAGAKYQSFSRNHTAVANNTTGQPAAFQATYTALLPSLAANYKISNDLSVYAQASQGFLAPGVAAFYVFDPSKNAIDPQRTNNYQVGAVYKTKNITASADAYLITATNFPVNVLDTDNKTVIGIVNGGTAQYKGVEGEATYAVGGGLAAYGSGSLSSAQFIDGANNGLAVANAPRYTAAGGLIFDNGKVFGSALYKITGDQYGAKGQTASSAAINGELNHVDSYNSTDLVAGFRTDALKQYGFGNMLELKAGVGNVFNNQALTDIGGTPSALTPDKDTLTYTYQAARTFYVSTKVDF